MITVGDNVTARVFPDIPGTLAVPLVSMVTAVVIVRCSSHRDDDDEQPSERTSG